MRLRLLAGTVLATCMVGALAQTGAATASALAPQPQAGNTSVSARPQAAADLAQGQAAPAAQDEADFAPVQDGNAFDIRIDTANDDIRELVQRHLDLKRYQRVSDLDQAELRELLTRSDINIRQLLATQGHFTPEIRQELLDNVDHPGTRPKVVIHIDPGPPTKVDTLDLQFDGAIYTYEPARDQLLDIYAGWTLPVGDTFTQTEWSHSKTMALRSLHSQRFPTARLTDSQALIDPDNSSAELHVRYDSGPVFRYGPVQIKGNERYAPVIIERLAQVRTGDDYRLSDMVDAQQRLLDSGYYNGAFVSIDTSEGVDPEQAPVLVQVQEAKLQRLVLGAGMSTDRGPRLSLDHMHNKDPIFGWRALTKVSVDQKLQSFGSSLMAPPDDNLWRWTVSGNINREKLSDVTTTSQQLRVGRTKQEKQIDRTWYLSYDHSQRRFDDGTRESSQALSANYIWTYRRFNSQTFPTSGYGIGLELGGGTTIQPSYRPFTRATARYLGFLSLDESLREGLRQAVPMPRDLKAVATGNADALTTQQPLLLAPTPAMAAKRQNGELVLRLDAGGVFARDDAVLPSSLLFLTGGDATVRGYGYQKIGARTDNGLITPGRYMVAGSLEYRRPVFLRGRPTDWDSVVFVDAGSVADKVSDLQPLKVGVGAGALWRSPVGPVQMSVGYGLKSHEFRLHLNLGFRF